MTELATIERLIQDQGQGFEAYKKSIDEQLVELKRGRADPVLDQRIKSIEKTLDDAVEHKASIDARIAAEKKEREDLEARLNAAGKSVKTADDLLVVDFTRWVNDRHQKAGLPPVETLSAEQVSGYKSAFAKNARHGDKQLSPDEAKLLQIGIDADGGFLVPPDTTGRIVRKIHEISPIRQIAAVQSISRDKLEGMEDLDEAGAAYAGERQTSGNTTTPQVGKYDIPVWDIDTEPEATQNLLSDAEVDVETWLANKVSTRFARFEGAEFCTGAAKIRGFTSYPVALDSGSGVAWGSLGYIKTGVNGNFAGSNPADKLFDLFGLLKDQYAQNARIVTRRAVVTLMRKFKDTAGQYLWQPSLVLGTPESFAGYPITRAEDMPALASNGNSLAFGDFQEGYQIVDRPGLRTIRDPFTAKPKVKFYTAKRVGGGVLNFEAIKILQFAA